MPLMPLMRKSKCTLTLFERPFLKLDDDDDDDDDDEVEVLLDELGDTEAPTPPEVLDDDRRELESTTEIDC